MNRKTIKQKTSKDFNPKWVTEVFDEPCLNFIEGFGFYLVDKRTPEDGRPGRNAMTTSQLRNIFSEAKQIESKVRLYNSKKKNQPQIEESEWKSDIKPRILLLRPKIAYATARALDRDRNSRMKDFGEVAEAALIEAATSPVNYLRFVNILEGIIAYHKKYGGRDK